MIAIFYKIDLKNEIQFCSKMNHLFFKNTFIRMNKFSTDKTLTNTIYALSSGLNTAISIIRVSGPNAKQALKLVNTQNAQKIVTNPRMMQFARIYNAQKKIIDEGMVVYFPSRMSYNKQDMIELHLHGSRAVVDAVFKQLKSMNMRMAQRGQITKRAVINGKLSLNQAEAINDLISSQTEFTRQVSINNLLGKNMNYIQSLRQELIKALAKSQAYIDFNQDESDVKQTLFDDTKIWVKDNVVPRVQGLLRNYKNLKILKDGVNVVIVGKPNVGKSTLINLISNKNVSIVNSKAGTTRDIIQTSIEHEGFRLNLIDTAGLRETECEIQNQGVKRAKQKIQQSHIKLLIVDVSQQKVEYNEKQKVLTIKINDEDKQIAEVFNDDKAIIIVNKIDLLDRSKEFKQVRVEMNVSQKGINKNSTPQVLMSAGVEKKPQQLFNILSNQLKQQYSCFLDPNEIFFTRQRYFNHLQLCLQRLELYVNENQVDFACQYLRQAIKQVESIFGRVDCQDVLDVLFRDFCIGK